MIERNEQRVHSQLVDEFNHDPWAAGYDNNVRDENDPVCAGNAERLAWTVEQAAIRPESAVIDLGLGTENTSAQLTAVGRLNCVDISTSSSAGTSTRHVNT